MTYLIQGAVKPKTIIFQLSPYRLLNLMFKLPKICKKPQYIMGVILMKAIDGLSFYLGLVSTKL